MILIWGFLWLKSDIDTAGLPKSIVSYSTFKKEKKKPSTLELSTVRLLYANLCIILFSLRFRIIEVLKGS